MKKKTALALVFLLLFLTVGSVPVLAANEPLDWNGVKLYFLDYRLSDTGDSPDLILTVRAVNDTDRPVWFNIDEAKVNDVEVSHAGRSIDAHSDTGSDDPLYFTFWATDDDPIQIAAIKYPRTLDLTIIIEDDETYEHLTEETVHLNLITLADDAASNPAPSSSSYSDSYSEEPLSTSSYRVLQSGDKGDDVRRMQEKLIELGYLNDKADGVFGPKTASAVQLFNESNGLRYDGVADAITQDCMFSGLANEFVEPWIPVDLPYTEWDRISEEGASYRVKVTNLSRTKTIKGIELQYYPSDAWGDNMWEYPFRKTTFNITLAPGETGYTDWFYLSPSWYVINTMNWGVSRVAFDDGTIHENDDVTYWTVSLH